MYLLNLLKQNQGTATLFCSMTYLAKQWLRIVKNRKQKPIKTEHRNVMNIFLIRLRIMPGQSCCMLLQKISMDTTTTRKFIFVILFFFWGGVGGGGGGMHLFLICIFQAVHAPNTLCNFAVVYLIQLVLERNLGGCLWEHLTIQQALNQTANNLMWSQENVPIQ